jgi:hypothetical protein
VVIASGLQGRESIIANPAPSIADGSTVQGAESKALSRR